MTVDWEDVLQKLRFASPAAHTLRPPCPNRRIEAVEGQLGKLPAALSAMLKHFNGAILFDVGAGGELVTLFGISEDPPLPPLEWAADWYIDKFTPSWRASENDREDQWAIAMMNYGELILLDGQGRVKKWDTSQRTWDRGPLSFATWIEELLREGQLYLQER